MKRTLQLLILLYTTACLYACHKNVVTPTNIAGIWELRETVNASGQAAFFSPGNAHIYEFNTNGTFSQYNGNDTLANSGTYSVKANAETINHIQYNELLLNNAATGPIVQVVDTNLSIGLQYNNGTSSLYARVNTL
jgi:hypothetical protein